MIPTLGEFKRFNSTMVRLKERLERGSECALFRFNSTMVRLKAGDTYAQSLDGWSFNSTMVRLKASGTVARVEMEPVSIPQWFD